MTFEPPTGWHWSQLGGVRWRQHRLAEARDCYRRALGIEPANSAYLEALGRVEIELGDYSGAAVEFERCLSLAPADAAFSRCLRLSPRNRRV